MVLAAPVLATVQLFFSYIIHKLLDQDPWADIETISPQPLKPLVPEVMKNVRIFRTRFIKGRFPWFKKG